MHVIPRFLFITGYCRDSHFLHFSQFCSGLGKPCSTHSKNYKPKGSICKCPFSNLNLTFFFSPSKKYMTNNKSAKENYTQNKRGEIKKHRNIVFLCVLVLIYKVNRNIKGACILSDMPKHVNCVNIHKDGHHYCSSSWRSSFIILLWSRHGAEI
jgi:hypothetical protein